MKIDGIDMRTLETEEQRDRFNNFLRQMHQLGFLDDEEILPSAPIGYGLIVAKGQIFVILPDDEFERIFGLNPVKSGTTHQHLAQEEGEESKKVPEQEIELDSDNDKSLKPLDVGLDLPEICFSDVEEEGEESIEVPEQDIKLDFDNDYSLELQEAVCNAKKWLEKYPLKDMWGVGGHKKEDELLEAVRNVKKLLEEYRLKDMCGVGDHEDVGERFNKLSVKGKQLYICKVPKLYNEVVDGRVFYIGETSGSSTKNMKYGRGETSGSSTKNMKYGCGETSGLSTKNIKYGRGETSGLSNENMNYGCGEIRGHSDRNHTHKNHSASDDEGNYEGLTEARQNKAAMKQNIDNIKVNDQHVVDMPESPDHVNKKEQANGLFKLCEIGLANAVSLMGSNPPPWATTLASQGLLRFSGAANAVGYVGNTAALSLRYTKPGVARIFANIGPIGCAWGVIMGFTSYFPREFQWLGYIAALFCTIAVLLANY